MLHNAGDVVHGPIDLRQALKVSSDVFFYTLGARTNVSSGDGGAIQQWANALGLGEPTGLDVGGEGTGRVPTPEQRNQAYAENTRPNSPCGEEVCLEEGEVTDREWSLGDNVNLAIGQGDVQVDPLQMAVAYAAIANGGDIVRPHVGLRVTGSAGARDPGDRPGDPRPRRDRPGRAADGHGRPARGGDGARGHLVPGLRRLSRSISPARPEPRRPGIGLDQSWYIAVAPYDNPKYVVAVTIERAGSASTPRRRRRGMILDELLDVDEAKIEEVESDGGGGRVRWRRTPTPLAAVRAPARRA